MVLAFFTFVVNVLVLVQPIYMLQIYDRVLTSASFDTLTFISILAAAALILLGIVDAVRAIICGRIAARLQVELGADAVAAAMRAPRASLGDVQPLRDLQTVRNYVSSRALLAFLDLPFVPFFIGILYFIHPGIFWMTVGGAAILALMAFANQRATRASARSAGDRSMEAVLSAQAFTRSAESLQAMGIVGNAIRVWGRSEAEALAAQDRLLQTNAMWAGLSRTLRMGLQVAIYGYGAYLVLSSEMSAGMIFAASLIGGRGLQPIDQVIGGWKGFSDAQNAWKRLSTALEAVASSGRPTELPAPEGHLSLEAVFIGAPHSQGGEPLVKMISANIPAGDRVAVIGPSGAGKSTLMRAIAGAIEIRSGTIRIDGADIRNWDREKLGRYFGYLAQEAELLPGTIAENIARFDPERRDEMIVEAAVRAHVHEMIQRLPRGYDTVIGPMGLQLSGGQRQRIGLARAFYGSPRVLVLDEPNANLDRDGELALEQALEDARARKVSVLIVTQRRQVVDGADKLMILQNGSLEDFGPRQEVLQRQAQKAQSRQAPTASAPLRPAAASTVVTARFPTLATTGRAAAE
ncbi:type I secretion system permease/ATPase [Consotaella salsifontis]|uniref:type I secretion system permease/ATPase n=1 Tax=Consotaella salsifontis TaxID=1365950 RepID=UPI0013F5A00F|nr:type I secretion system permease/ATPase [Consotaella salsifontis]